MNHETTESVTTITTKTYRRVNTLKRICPYNFYFFFTNQEADECVSVFFIPLSADIVLI